MYEPFGPMGQSFSMFTALVCASICIRLMAFRRDGAKYKLWISLCAYIMAAASGCQALAMFLGMYQIQSPFVLVILVALAILIFRARGNVAKVMRLEWIYPVTDRRRH